MAIKPVSTTSPQLHSNLFVLEFTNVKTASVDTLMYIVICAICTVNVKYIFIIIIYSQYILSNYNTQQRLRIIWYGRGQYFLSNRLMHNDDFQQYTERFSGELSNGLCFGYHKFKLTSHSSKTVYTIYAE